VVVGEIPRGTKLIGPLEGDYLDPVLYVSGAAVLGRPSSGQGQCRPAQNRLPRPRQDEPIEVVDKKKTGTSEDPAEVLVSLASGSTSQSFENGPDTGDESCAARA
jgi:hypothetical protein